MSRARARNGFVLLLFVSPLLGGGIWLFTEGSRRRGMPALENQFEREEYEIKEEFSKFNWQHLELGPRDLHAAWMKDLSDRQLQREIEDAKAFATCSGPYSTNGSESELAQVKEDLKPSHERKDTETEIANLKRQLAARKKK